MEWFSTKDSFWISSFSSSSSIIVCLFLFIVSFLGWLFIFLFFDITFSELSSNWGSDSPLSLSLSLPFVESFGGGNSARVEWRELRVDLEIELEWDNVVVVVLVGGVVVVVVVVEVVSLLLGIVLTLEELFNLILIPRFVVFEVVVESVDDCDEAGKVLLKNIKRMSKLMNKWI